MPGWSRWWSLHVFWSRQVVQPFSSGIHRFLWAVQHSLFSPALSPVTPVISSLLALPSPNSAGAAGLCCSSPLSHLAPLCLSRHHPGLVPRNRNALCRREAEPETLRGICWGQDFGSSTGGAQQGWSLPRLGCGTAALARSALQVSTEKSVLSRDRKSVV